jgi:chromosome segregation ATPase
MVGEWQYCREGDMEKLVPLLLLALGLGAAHLGIGGLIKLRPSRPEFWLFGLGVRTRLGAVKVLVVAIALLFLAYSFHRRGSITQIFNPEEAVLREQNNVLIRDLKEAEESIENYKGQVKSLSQEKEECQKIVSRQGLGLANKDDAVGELRAALGTRQREIADLQGALAKVKEEMSLLQKEHEQMSQAYNQTKEKLQQLNSQVDTLQNEKGTLAAKLEQNSNQNAADLKGLREENGRLKALYRDEEHRASLLRQGLVLREANDWALEQEIQRLANLLSDQPELNSPRQTDISRALQKINQVLREGTTLTKQAKAADSKPTQPGQKAVDPLATKKNGP